MTAEPATARNGPKGQYFQFVDCLYDIDLALRLLAADPGRLVHRVAVAPTARALGVEMTLEQYLAARLLPITRANLDEDYARTRADVTVPVIVGDLSTDGPPATTVIDGCHRVRRAVIEGLETLPAYLLTRAEVAQIRVRAAVCWR